MYYIFGTIGVVGVATAIVGLTLFLTTADPAQAMPFINAYGEYYELAEKQESLIHAPGAGTNKNRAAIHSQLSAILTGELTDEERKTIAEQSLVSIGALRSEIDAATQTREQVEKALANVEFEAKQVPEHLSDEVELMLGLMHDRQAAVADVAATLYSINGQTEEILQTIILNEGALTDDHIISINNATQDAEFRFNRLTDQYEYLQKLTTQLDEASDAFVARAL